jgi:proteasome lid subunit RPN8/RPN11
MQINKLLNNEGLERISAIAKKEYDDGKKECCGLILLDGSIKECVNKDSDPTLNFAIDSRVYSRAENKYGVKAIYHSHTNGNMEFTASDVDLANRTQKPVMLYDVVHNRFSAIDPSGDTELIGRDFCYGIYDCYSLIRDYYKQVKGVEIPNYHRSSDELVWDKVEWDWIDSQYQLVGFREVPSPEQGDVLAMSIGNNARGINHLAIYMGDNTLLHQLAKRKSGLEIWGSPWSEYTIKFLRYYGVS